jgi:DNA-binding NtrC family response regulator
LDTLMTLMKVGDTWPTLQQDDSDANGPELDSTLAHVRVLTGAAPHSVHVVVSGGTSIGRVGGGCTVVIDDGRMSRSHARIERGAAGWQLQDLGSLNGGYVEGRGCGRGSRAALFDGAVIRLGDTVMVFRTSAPTAYGQADSPAFPGVSPDAAAVRRRIDLLAGGAGHVLIVGETGTGKEHVAQAIAARRAPHPFVALNCAQLDRQLARSELFGHARGAFTNANANKPGLVDEAEDGVLFLDEIGELPLEVQPELLRFLEDGSYRPIGSTELRHSTARVVAATNVDLDEAVQNGKFRQDVLARLRARNGPLQLPPLRERREDILWWTQLFFRKIGCDPGPVPWTVGALECLLLYPWDENLRGLEGSIRHVVEQSPRFPCGVEHLPPDVRNLRMKRRAASTALGEEPTPADGRPSSRSTVPAPSSIPPPIAATPLPVPSRPTQSMIQDALEQTQGRMRRAAQVLGIDRTRLYRLCRTYKIDYKGYRGPDGREDDDEDEEPDEESAPSPGENGAGRDG